MDWLTNNIGSIIVGAIVFAILVAVVASLVRKRKRGVSISCDCGCDGCAASSTCHSSPDDNSPK
jgi:hypothetical protein